MKTDLSEKLFQGKGKPEEVISDGDCYVLKVTYNDTPYIVKGRKLIIEQWMPTANNQNVFLSLVKEIGSIHQDYFLSKLGSTVNEHIGEAVEIGHAIVTDINKLYLYIEIAFKYEGEILLSAGDVSEVCKVMKESLEALSLLHKAGIPHLNFGSNSLIHNKKTKLINLGKSFDHSTQSNINEALKAIDKTLDSLMKENSPPEILKWCKGIIPAEFDFILGAIDVYCWSMCFYKLLTGKTRSELETEAETFKYDRESYEEFMKKTKEALDQIELKDQNQKEVVVEVIMKSLSYNPSERPSVADILTKMKGCSITAGEELKEVTGVKEQLFGNTSLHK